jgi:hypothetical protein
MSPPRIEVHVERLVLDGLDVPDQAALGPAVERALAATLAGGGIAPWLGADTRRGTIDAGTIEPGGQPLADGLARRVADALGGRGAR